MGRCRFSFFIGYLGAGCISTFSFIFFGNDVIDW